MSRFDRIDKWARERLGKPEGLVRVARADRFIEETETEEFDEPHLDYYSDEELYELARMGDEILKEIDERQ